MTQANAEREGALGDRLSQALAEALDWSWDGRFQTALAEFTVDQQGEILEILERFLPQSWDADSLADAPDATRSIARRLGGVMPGQQLLVSDPSAGPVLFCAWWPWGNGHRVSIRIGLARSDEEAASANVGTGTLKTWFGV